MTSNYFVYNHEIVSIASYFKTIVHGTCDVDFNLLYFILFKIVFNLNLFRWIFVFLKAQTTGVNAHTNFSQFYYCAIRGLFIQLLL